MRKLSVVAPGWWDYTTLDDKIPDEAAKLTIKDIEQLSRPGFAVKFYDTREDFYLAEALEYIHAWRQAKPGQARRASAARSGPPSSSRSSPASSTSSD